MKLIFTALIILIGIQNSFCAPVAKKKPASKEYNFYKVGNKYLFKIKNKMLFMGDRLIAGCDGSCYLIPMGNDNDTSRVKINFEKVVLKMEYSDLFESNPSTTLEDQEMKSHAKTATIRFEGKDLPAPEDAISLLPYSMTFEVLNKRGKRFLKEDKKFASYIDKFAKCVKKKDMECEFLHKEDRGEIPTTHYDFIRMAFKDIKKYIAYNYNKGIGISTPDLKTSCGFYKEKKEWIFYCSPEAVFGSELESIL